MESGISIANRSIAVLIPPKNLVARPPTRNGMRG